MDKDNLLQKWLNGELNDEEKSFFTQLEDYQENLDILDAAQHFKASHFSEIDDFDAFKQRYNSQNIPVKTLNWIHPFLRIASILVVAFGVYFTFFYNNFTEYNTVAAEKITIELPDQSKVVLNAESSINFYQRRWDTKRQLKLNGEAYFQVEKGKTFDVITETGTVTVVGTEFNVLQREGYFEVQCYEGIVDVVSDTIQRRLLAGDLFKIINGNFTQGSIKAALPSWTTNISRFDAIPIRQVLDEVERQYNVQITTEDLDENRQFTGGFSHDELVDALEAITQPMNLTYKMNTSNSVVIHGKKE